MEKQNYYASDKTTRRRAEWCFQIPLDIWKDGPSDPALIEADGSQPEAAHWGGQGGPDDYLCWVPPQMLSSVFLRCNQAPGPSRLTGAKHLPTTRQSMRPELTQLKQNVNFLHLAA